MLLLYSSLLRHIKEKLSQNDACLQAALQKVRAEATQIKVLPIRTVMDKEYVPPSGDKHDYLSFGPYWWPNPETPDGLPFIRRDGLVNPDTEDSDKPALNKVMREAETLSVAYFYGGDESFAQSAAARLRVWFIDPATRMNPHLEYGQAIPGHCDGRCIGIIDTVSLRLLPDIVELLESSESWTQEDSAAVRAWMAAYLEWLLTSSHGLEEAKQHNNHGTWYDVQVALLALATGREDVAREVLQAAPTKRFAPHIAPDGSQPHELARTRSFSYSCYNLHGFFDLATLAEHFGSNLWQWRGENGAGLEQALDYLAPYADDGNPWPYEQVAPDDGSRLLELLLRGSTHYDRPDWAEPLPHTTQRSATSAQLQLMWSV